MTEKNLVFIATQLNDQFKQLWHQSPPSGMTLTDDPSQATIVLGEPPIMSNTLDRYPKLQWLQSTFAGVDALLIPEVSEQLEQQNIQLTNIKGIFGQLISEYVIGYIYAHYRHLFIYKQQQANSEWNGHTYSSLLGKKVLILGTGSIGIQVCQNLNALGFDVMGVNSRGIIPEQSDFSVCYPVDKLNDAVAQADVIINALPKTPQTREILNQSSLSHCQSALLFNIGRGNAIEEAGLLTALDKGWIEHAFLDVFPVEPLPESSPYWSHEKITITPHIAAISFPEQIYAIFKRNCKLWREGKTLDYLVDRQKGY